MNTASQQFSMGKEFMSGVKKNTDKILPPKKLTRTKYKNLYCHISFVLLVLGSMTLDTEGLRTQNFGVRREAVGPSVRTTTPG